MSGRETGSRALLLRAAMNAGSIPYSLVTRFRNQLFQSNLRKAAQLPKPVISVGNITTGGTGKTPVVRWLAERLRERGKHVAILSRGYKAKPGQLGDEQRMLANLLNRPGTSDVIIRADPNRFQAGQSVLREYPEVDAFVLDDGFQHRQLARNFDLVLINAAEPFGYGRVLPRGMLREPLSGLSRASALLITRVDQTDEIQLAAIRERLRQKQLFAPIFESEHGPSCFRSSDSETPIPLEALRDKHWFAFCGIAGPDTFIRQISFAGGTSAGQRVFGDHHDYTDAEVQQMAAKNADVLVTTEKDWAKLALLPSVRELKIPIWRLDIQIRFHHDDETQLLELIERSL